MGSSRDDDALRHLGRPLMLPEPQDSPPFLLESPGRVEIPLAVSLDLRTPVGSICPRRDEVLGAAVPETTVDEHCDPPPGKHDVGSSAAVRSERRVVDAVAEACGMEESPDGELRTSVSADVALHRRARSLGGRPTRSCTRTFA